MLPKKKVVYNGRELYVYSIAWMSALTGRTNGQIRRWEKREILPEPALDVGPMRWYLADELIGYASIFLKAHARSGVSLLSLGIRNSCREFQTAFRKKLETNIDAVLKVLPNEARYLPRGSDDVKMRKAADHLTNMLENKKSRRKTKPVLF